MTPEELKVALEECINRKEIMRDTEDIHEDMDVLLVKALRSLGYGDAMDIFENQTKWYS